MISIRTEATYINNKSVIYYIGNLISLYGSSNIVCKTNHIAIQIDGLLKAV